MGLANWVKWCYLAVTGNCEIFHGAGKEMLNIWIVQSATNIWISSPVYNDTKWTQYRQIIGTRGH